MSLNEEKRTECIQGANLSLYQRFFCKPTNVDSEELDGARHYRFSFLSRGFIIATVMLSVLLTLILAPTLASVHHGANAMANEAQSQAVNTPSPGTTSTSASIAVGTAQVNARITTSASSTSATTTAQSVTPTAPVLNSAPVETTSPETPKAAPIVPETPAKQDPATSDQDAGNQVSSNPATPVVAPAAVPGVVTDSTVSLSLYGNFADPFIVQHEGLWYAYATNNVLTDSDNPSNLPWLYDLNNVQMATSPDLYTWTMVPNSAEPLPNVGAWADNTRRKANPKIPNAGVWSPAVFRRPSDNKWVMYYSARPNGDRLHCLGAAVGSSPAGPFIPEAASFACPLETGGAIDPAPFIETVNGAPTISIIYKVDGNHRGNGGECGNTIAPIKDTPIMLQRVKADGVTPDGAPVKILDRTDADGPLVEAPTLIKSADGTYFLFYSSGCTFTNTYTVMYAWSKTLTGPYTRVARPLLKSGTFGLNSPGSAALAQDAKGVWRLAFHARVPSAYGDIRAMFTSGVKLEGTTATLFNPDGTEGPMKKDPTRAVQFAPGAGPGGPASKPPTTPPNKPSSPSKRTTTRNPARTTFRRTTTAPIRTPVKTPVRKTTTTTTTTKKRAPPVTTKRGSRPTTRRAGAPRATGKARLRPQVLAGLG